MWPNRAGWLAHDLRRLSGNRAVSTEGLPTAQQAVRALLTAGAPRYDLAVTFEILDGDGTDEEKRESLARLERSKAYSPRDAWVWEQARALLAELYALDVLLDTGTIDRATYRARCIALLLPYGDDVQMTLLHLRRSDSVAFEHVKRRTSHNKETTDD